MNIITLFTLLPILASAIPARVGQQNVNIVYHVSKESGETSIEIFNENESELLVHSCSQSLISGAFLKDSVIFNVDAEGAGTLQIGTQNYVVHDNLTISGGVECGRISSPMELIINCLAPVPKALPLAPIRKRGNLKNCFSRVTAPVELEDMRQAFQANSSDLTPPQLGRQLEQRGILQNETSLSKRRFGCGISRGDTRMVGNGNPHQNPLHIQLSEPMACGQGGCDVGQSQSRSFAVSFSAQATVWQWLSGGFAVQWQIETGNTHLCKGNPYDYLAVWRKQAQTAYTVENGVRYTACSGFYTSGEPYVLWSPNQGNRGGYFYCVHGRQYVRWQGDRWLDTSPAVPGGPP